ncbi:tetraspanin family protein [archaeon]|nr:tetraspanin family protein [archaeon]
MNGKTLAILFIVFLFLAMGICAIAAIVFFIMQDQGSSSTSTEINDPVPPNLDDNGQLPDNVVSAICGNNVKDLGEECDGTDDSSCPNSCNINCNCVQLTEFTDECNDGLKGWSEPKSSAEQCGWPVGAKGYVTDCCCCYTTAHVHDLRIVSKGGEITFSFKAGTSDTCKSGGVVYSSVNGENWDVVTDITGQGKVMKTHSSTINKEFRYIKISIPECKVDYSNVSYMADCTLDDCELKGSNECSQDSDCDDGNPCNAEVCTGIPKQCYTLELSCKDDDNCCPASCDHFNDNDCEEPPCEADSDCDDKEPCTQNKCISGSCDYSQAVPDETNCGQLIKCMGSDCGPKEGLCCDGKCRTAFCYTDAYCGVSPNHIMECRDPGTCKARCHVELIN